VKIYIGHDEREQEAFDVACKSLLKVSPAANPEMLAAGKLAAQGLLTRTSDHRGGQDYDFVSNAPKSTRFAVSRFLVPILCQDGYALFTDCDVVFLQDPKLMLDEIEPGKAVYVVKHAHVPTAQYKMVNQLQTVYPRKNWSSVMLFDCNHPANRRLTLHDINYRPGRDLHAFYWLHDSEIGTLHRKWNWLVNEQLCPDTGPYIAHFTNGGPWIEGWHGAPYDNIWLEARNGIATSAE
jgi:hypothetical protein